MANCCRAAAATPGQSGPEEILPKGISQRFGGHPTQVISARGAVDCRQREAANKANTTAPNTMGGGNW
jgi:hypothetical protein